MAIGQPGNAEHFVSQQPQAEAGDGSTAFGDFHFRDIEVTHKSNPNSKVMTL